MAIGRSELFKLGFPDVSLSLSSEFNDRTL
uniref:Uncharacterized protein n=1 Tax=Nelumbo nucifera TaxID=4432 RepID=A0A822YV77_NELNU|nr:TPA_asm: hypothetical protein HUJ06_007061 [Nelumbo nucifera]